MNKTIVEKYTEYKDEIQFFLWFFKERNKSKRIK